MFYQKHCKETSHMWRFNPLNCCFWAYSDVWDCSSANKGTFQEKLYWTSHRQDHSLKSRKQTVYLTICSELSVHFGRYLCSRKSSEAALFMGEYTHPSTSQPPNYLEVTTIQVKWNLGTKKTSKDSSYRERYMEIIRNHVIKRERH